MYAQLQMQKKPRTIGEKYIQCFLIQDSLPPMEIMLLQQYPSCLNCLLLGKEGTAPLTKN